MLAGALRKQDVGPRNPLCATELPGGERLQICMPPAVPAGTAQPDDPQAGQHGCAPVIACRALRASPLEPMGRPKRDARCEIMASCSHSMIQAIWKAFLEKSVQSSPDHPAVRRDRLRQDHHEQDSHRRHPRP